MFNRKESAIQRRLIDLKIKARPLKEERAPWTNEECNKLAEMIKYNYTYEMMSEVLNKSSKAIKGKVYNMYITEDIDAVKKMIGDGPWGTGRPQLNITHKKLFGEERKQVKRDITKLINILNNRMQQLYDESDYWQSKICQNYSKKCMIENSCCDECTNFLRIKPQYCNRCGATVMSREKINICDRCKAQRKKQYQRKYMVMHKNDVNNKVKL